MVGLCAGSEFTAVSMILYVVICSQIVAPLVSRWRPKPKSFRIGFVYLSFQDYSN